MDCPAFDQSDFTRNPNKYLLFRTAELAQPIPSRPDLPVGSLLQLSYFGAQANRAAKSECMPIYRVWPAGADPANAEGLMLYACALRRFCL